MQIGIYFGFNLFFFSFFFEVICNFSCLQNSEFGCLSFMELIQVALNYFKSNGFNFFFQIDIELQSQTSGITNQ